MQKAPNDQSKVQRHVRRKMHKSPHNAKYLHNSITCMKRGAHNVKCTAVSYEGHIGTHKCTTLTVLSKFQRSTVIISGRSSGSGVHPTQPTNQRLYSVGAALAGSKQPLEPLLPIRPLWHALGVERREGGLLRQIEPKPIGTAHKAHVASPRRGRHQRQ